MTLSPLHRRACLLALLLLYTVQSGRSLFATMQSKSGRDYATYHYAVQEAWSGGDPYDTKALGRRARAEGTRRGVHPFLYPPPFLLGMVWAVPFSLHTAAQIWFGIQQICLVGTLAVLQRWLGVSTLALAAILALFTPIPDSLKMGQANLAVLLLMVAGLARSAHQKGGGLLMAGAGMAKMSPALHLFGWLASGRWRPALVAAGGAVALSVLTLPLVDFESQLAFYTDILPGFASGEYHGLKVPITLPANHSIPDLFNQLWPGPDRHHLSASAAHATRAVSLLALGVLLWVFRHARGTTGLACGFGAVTVLATITPVYTYEHHLSFLLFPAVALYAAHRDRLLSRWMTAPALAAGVLIACPLYVLRPLQKALPPLAWALQESKFAGSLALGVLCAVAAWRSGTLSDSEARLRTPPGK